MKKVLLLSLLLVFSGCLMQQNANTNVNRSSAPLKTNTNINARPSQNQNNTSPNANAGKSGFSKIRKEGEMCGGIAGFVCDTGLTCQLDGQYPDAGGTCIKAGAALTLKKEGENCGGVAAYKCEQGLFCKEDTNATDEYGVCVKNTSDNITSFDDCAAAGYPVLESYPRQCKTPEGKSFTETIVGQTGPETSCKTDSDCYCRNFDGTQFLEGKTPGSCDVDAGYCKPCFYR